MTRLTWALLPLVMLLTGCPPERCAAPATRREALQRVNDNLTRIDRPLHYKAIASFKFRDERGRVHRFIGHEASLIFMPPRWLRFDVRSLVGPVAQFGSDGTRYWLWIDVPDARKLWYGSWDHVQDGAARKLVIPPNELLDALMLRPLPMQLPGGSSPVLRTEGDDCRLVYWRGGTAGDAGGLREVRFDRYQPGQPVEIIDRLADGSTALRAVLGNYRRIGADGPLTARRYEIYWPGDEAEVRVDVLSAKFRPELEIADVCEFPAGWQGDIESLDAAAQPRIPETTEVRQAP